MLRRRHILQALPFSVLTMAGVAHAQQMRAYLEDSPPDFAVPANATDCHVHVFEDPARFPLDPKRAYTPGMATSDDLIAHLAKIKCERVVLVQPSPYGNDNSAILTAAKRLGNRARCVAVVAEDVTDDTLDKLNAAGTRGIRINLSTTGIEDTAVAARLVTTMAARIAKRNWHIQMYTDLSVIAALKDTVAKLPMPFVFDHFGRLDAAKGMNQPGLSALFDLVKNGRAYVKISAAYRISQKPDYSDVQDYSRALIAANPDRILWGSDWPHPTAPPGTPEKIFPFRNEDDGAALNRFARWAQTPAMIERILVTNPARLYDW